jgi:hypothetical protein
MSGINYLINTFIQTHSDEFQTSKECRRVHTCSQVSLVMSVGQDHSQLWKRMCRLVACILRAKKLRSLKPYKLEAEMMQTYSCHHKFNYSKFPCIFHVWLFTTILYARCLLTAPTGMSWMTWIWTRIKVIKFCNSCDSLAWQHVDTPTFTNRRVDDAGYLGMF